MINGDLAIEKKDGAPSRAIAFCCLKKVAEIDWVYGRYNELVFMGFHGLQTNVHITGRPHPVGISPNI